jgi:hypothetical protein
MQDLVTNVVATLQRARSEGMGLYLQTFALSTVEAAYLAAPRDWEQLLEGCADSSGDFLRRLHAGEGLYLSLCEVLMRHAPDEGLRLWRALLGGLRSRRRSVRQSHRPCEQPANQRVFGPVVLARSSKVILNVPASPDNLHLLKSGVVRPSTD